MRTHPPSLPTLARQAIDAAGLIQRGDRVLVAVSGGPDSMALLHVLSSLRLKRGFSLVAHGVDHGLRPAAATELDQAEQFAASLDVPFARTTLQLSQGGNLQARAREARYEALRVAKVVNSATTIATAHHADDRAETVLLRLLRGAGPAGLAVLPPRAADLVRPFVRARRGDIDAYVSRHRIPFASDPSNRASRFLRTRVRTELLPLMAELNPGIVEHLCALSDQLAEIPAAALPAGFLTLPRKTRVALGDLVRRRSKTARVPLPGGLVAALDATQASVVVLPESFERDNCRPADDDKKPPFAESGHHKSTQFSDPPRRGRTNGERSFP